MTYSEKYHKHCKDWQCRATIMNLYHQLMIATEKSWSVTRTAEYFDTSVGLVSENLKIAKKINLVRDCASRSAALEKLQEIKNV